MLTVEYRGDGKGDGVVEVHSGEEGARFLADRISRCMERGVRDHLMTLSWAGPGSNEERLDPEAELTNKVSLRRFWPTGQRRQGRKEEQEAL